MRKLKAIVQLFRPELPFAAGVCVVAGESMALGRFPPGRECTLGFLCAFFLSGAAIALNDYFDLEVDRVNAPERPLPMGSITPAEAMGLAMLAGGAGLAAAWMINLAAFGLCALMALISFLYNWKFKEAGLAGNLMVSSCVGITFITGSVAVGQSWNTIVWVFALMAFCIDLGEEIAGDAMDMEGDRKRSSQSIAIRRGRGFALMISSLLFGLVILLSSIPIVFRWLGLSYLVMIALTDMLIVFFTVRLWQSRRPAEGRSAMRGIYLGALAGLLAFMAGKFLE